MPKGVAAKGSGTRRPKDAPIGYRHHAWVAACNVPLKPHEVDYFLNKAKSDTRNGRDSTGNASVSRAVEVLDVLCTRCGKRPGQQEWCPRYPTSDWDLPR